MSRDKTPRAARRGGLFDPVYALVGMTEVTAGTLRDLGAGDASRSGRATRGGPGLLRWGHDVADIVRGTTRVPGAAVDEVRHRYSDLAERGHQTVAGAVPRVGRKAPLGDEAGPVPTPERRRRPVTPLRRASASDMSVSSINPVGGRFRSSYPGRAAAGGVEAGASLSFRRSPRVRSVEDPAQGDAGTSPTEV